MNDFKVKYNQAMKRASFFTVFDETWEACRGKTQNIISGFRKAGLIPFDPNALDYSRLIDEEKIANELNHGSSHIPAQLKLGIMRSLKCFDLHLPESTIDMFNKRVDEDNDVDDDSEIGSLFKIFRSIKRLLKDSTPGMEASITVASNDRSRARSPSNNLYALGDSFTHSVSNPSQNRTLTARAFLDDQPSTSHDEHFRPCSTPNPSCLQIMPNQLHLLQLSH